MGKGVERAFAKLDIAYDTFFYQMTDWEQDDNFIKLLQNQLLDKKYDAVFSVNYNPLISMLCEENKILYVSWVYDSPIHIRNEEPMKCSCNRIFFFDRGLVEDYCKRGIPVRYMPLAADIETFVEQIIKKEPSFDGDISFVGQLYQTEYMHYMEPLLPFQRGYLEGIIASQMKISGGYLLPELLNDKLLDELNVQYLKASSGEVKLKMRELEYLLAQETTGRERYLALALLSKRFPLKLYASEHDNRLTNVEQMDYIDYYSQMPKVFAQSKINLNISLRCIRTGIPLRVLDVLASGGFLITNFQPELAEYFNLGEDLVVYQSLEELVALTEYYLQHEEERKQIARNGWERVQQDFRFEDRIKSMLLEAEMI
jgi:spore maturation protein CgeB